MGTDLIRVREYAARATKKEYAVVFPDYFYGQINEARHQKDPDHQRAWWKPGTHTLFYADKAGEKEELCGLPVFTGCP
jgi:dienelactone hydrolase